MKVSPSLISNVLICAFSGFLLFWDALIGVDGEAANEVEVRFATLASGSDPIPRVGFFIADDSGGYVSA